MRRLYTLSLAASAVVATAGAAAFAVQGGWDVTRGLSEPVVLAQPQVLAPRPSAATAAAASPTFYDGFEQMDPAATLAGAGYTVITVNGARNTWRYNPFITAEVTNGRVSCTTDAGKEMDAWLITPAIGLQAGAKYRVSLDVATAKSSTERIEVFIGQAPTVEAMTAVLVERTELKSPDWKTFTAAFTPQADGQYYIGVHGCSEPDRHTLYVDNLTVGAPIGADCPADAQSLTVAAGADYRLTYHVQLQAPAALRNGQPLDGPLDWVKVDMVDEAGAVTAVISQEAVAPGQELSHDGTVNADGLYTFRVTSQYQGRASDVQEALAVIGQPRPGAPTDATITQLANLPGMVELTWRTPQTDAYGGATDASILSYWTHVVDDAGGYGQFVGYDVTGNSVIRKFAEPDAQQQFLRMGVSAQTRGGMSRDFAVTERIPVGAPYAVPYTESFPGAAKTHILGTMRTDEALPAAWSLYDDTDMEGVASQDGDNGFLGFRTQYVTAGAVAVSGNVDLSGVLTPKVGLYAFGAADNHNALDVMVRPCGRTDWTVLGSYTVDALGGDGWQPIEASLKPYAGQMVSLGIRATAVDKATVAVDNIRVWDDTQYNLRAVSLTAPSNVTSGVDHAVTLTVANIAAKAVKGAQYSINLMRNGRQVARRRGVALEPGAEAAVEFTTAINPTCTDRVEYQAVIDFAADDDPADNASPLAYCQPTLPAAPAPRGLTAVRSAAGSVLLGWDAPELDTPAKAAGTAGEVTEDFESYDAYAISALGPWTLVDADGTDVDDSNFGVSGPMSFWVMDNSLARYAGQALYEAHSGSKYLVSLAVYGDDNYRKDDWLISPRLNGQAQTVTFWVRLPFTDPDNSLQVLTSSTGNALADFTTTALELTSFSSDWAQYSVDLPGGTQYFALRSSNESYYFLFVDDITYTPEASSPEGLEVAGYNVYRDHQLLTAQPLGADAREYADATAGDDAHTYHVTAVYTGETGEGRASAPATVDAFSGADAPGVGDGDEVDVCAIPGVGVAVNGNAAGVAVTVHALDGRMVAAGAGNCTLEAAPGLYVVRVGSHSFKIKI